MFRLPFHITRRQFTLSQRIKQNKQVWQQLRSFGRSRDRSKETISGMEEDNDDSFEDESNDIQVSPDDMELFQYDPNVFNERIIGEEENEEDERRKQKIRDDLELKTGRGWSDPWEINDEDLSSQIEWDDLPNWTPDHASKFSLDRVKVFEGGIPTLAELSELPLPPPPPPRPSSNIEVYKAYRSGFYHDYILSKVKIIAAPRIEAIKRMKSWEEKQDAVDELFESVEFQLKDEEDILGRQPNFGMMVERAIEEYLESIQTETNVQKSESEAGKEKNNSSEGVKDEVVPLFMDLFDKNEISDEAEGIVVPKIVHPLKPHSRIGVGRMVEEWELSAHDKTRRIMLRESTQEIARIIDRNTSPRILLNGSSGCGKSATICSIVASARKSGHIVLYVPDGDRLRKHGYYLEPNPKIPGLFDLPVLSKEMCENLLESHEVDLEGFIVSEETRDKFLDDKSKKLLPEEYKDELSIVGLLKLGAQDEDFAPMCYSVVIDYLMNQDKKSFLMVLDEFNCYYDYGHYFHMDFNDANDPVPLNRISLFRPLLASMGLSQDLKKKEKMEVDHAIIKRGGVIAAISENRAVARKFTDSLVESAIEEAAKEVDGDISHMHIITIPRYSKLELEHILSNFDIIGLGRLRFDKGDTVIDEQEVSYLRMISGSNGQQLLDACVV